MPIIVNEYTQELEGVIEEVVAQPDRYDGARYMPLNPRGARTIRNVIEEGSGGLTREHVIGTDPHLVQRPGRRVAEYRGGFYRESFRMDEDEILHLRAYQSGDLALRGLQEQLDRTAEKAERRIAAQMEKLRWDAIFNGNWVYLGQTIDFGVPGGNRVTPSTVWTTAATATPLADLRTWLSTTFRKYRVTEIVMNRVTANMMLNTTEVQNLLQAVGGRAASQISGNDPSQILSFFFPGAPPIRVYDEWYQTESLSGDKIVLSAPQLFIPDGLLYFHHQTMGDDIGDLILTPNLQTGTAAELGSGIFVVIDDKVEEKPGNPYMEVIAGFNGAPRLRRPFDLITADVD